ncbi:hypothetical protein [Secundilactobacillus similis]|uniref:Uncharacterized protein n=1 Tax=Secundilactobacillus similis DSM 23365 = JCM 2765 TaxID=1423804 RepID=A0A0R2F790_9LACO|nr:hypothetical protein [Secundilactobacillus similis]KRN21146.1 hypothetical protein FD14_GL001267 [Secundilactobacillus similis DSM 23365 = JCM 2765]
MKKALTGIVVTAAAFVGVTLATIQPAQASSTKFTASEINKPTGYFNSTKAQYAFHWKTVKNKKGTVHYLIFGDFSKPALSTGVVSAKYKLSKTHRTLTTTYRAIDSKGNLGKTYKFTLYKQSSTKYRGYLTYQGVNVHQLSTKGTAYTFTKTKTSPATKFAQYAKPTLTSYYTDELNANVQKEYQEGIAAGKNYKDPATDSDVQAKIKDTVNTQVASDLVTLAKSFNG